MENKKSIIIPIIAVFLLIVVVSAGTYAFIITVTDEKEVSAGSGMLGIDYVAPDDITGDITLSPSSSRSGGIVTSGSATLQSNSETALFNMYITPTAISDSLKIGAFKWEAEGIRDGTVVCSGSGDFSSATVNNKIPVIEGCILSTTVTTFNVYIWLDYNDEDYVPVGLAEFAATIGADSVPITGGF